MSTNLTTDCHPAECQATFTINGERGDQKFSYGCIVTLQADEKEADTFLWEVISSPPRSGNLLTGSVQSQARLSLPFPGTYIVQLTVTKGDCTAQARHTILVGVSDCVPYPCPYLCHPIEQPEETPARVVAAGILDLGQRPETQGAGSLLTLRAIDPSQGLATLHFEGYDYALSQKGVYVIKALPYQEQAGTLSSHSGQQDQGQSSLVIVQFIQFCEEGFQLRMVDLAQLPNGRPNLGPCMIEVSEVWPHVPQSSKTDCAE